MKYILILCVLLLIYPSTIYANDSIENPDDVEIIYEDGIMPYSSDYFFAALVNLSSSTTGYVDAEATFTLKSTSYRVKIRFQIYDASSNSVVDSYETTSNTSYGSIKKSFKVTSGNTYYCIAKFYALDSDGNTLETVSYVTSPTPCE